MKHFQRPRHASSPRTNTRTPRGTVRVQILTFEHGKMVPGSASRTFRVPNAKVSEVARLAEDAIFGKER